jgi:hypothetical protein
VHMCSVCGQGDTLCERWVGGVEGAAGTREFIALLHSGMLAVGQAPSAMVVNCAHDKLVEGHRIFRCLRKHPRHQLQNPSSHSLILNCLIPHVHAPESQPTAMPTNRLTVRRGALLVLY